MTFNSEDIQSKTQSHSSLIVFAGICVICLTIYFWRFLQVMQMRKLLLQSKDYSYIYTSSVISTTSNNKTTLFNQDIKIILPGENQIHPGQTLEVIGSFDPKVQSLFSSEIILTGRSFKILKREGSLVSSSFYAVLTFLEEIPRETQRRLSGFLESSHLSLLAGMVFGGVNSMPKDLLQAMKNTGLTHITSASGFNVAVLIGFSLSLFTRFLNHRRAAILCLITTISYSVMSGLTPPIARATLMGGLYLFSVLVGKPYSAMRSLLVALAIMLIYRPFLIFSVSFQLSAMSTLGLILSPLVFAAPKEGIGILGEVRSLLEENLKTTVSVLLFTTPITLITFGTFSLAALIANPLLLWMVAPLTLAGLVFTGIILIWPPLGFLASVPLTLFLEVFERSVKLFSGLPLALLPVLAPRVWGLFAWYGILVLFLGCRWQHNKTSAKE